MSERPPSLVDMAEPFLALVLRLEREAESSAEDLVAKAERALLEFEGAAQRGGISLTDIDAAKYALAALLDERVLCSELPCTADWINQPLQMRLFDSFAAGEEFYTRLDDLRRDPAGARIPAIEVYLCCLALGFKGKLDDRRGDEQRKVLMDQLAEQVRQAWQVDPATPAPHAYRPVGGEADSKPLSWWRRVPAWVFLLAVVVLLAVVALVMDAIVSSAVSRIEILVGGA